MLFYLFQSLSFKNVVPVGDNMLERQKSKDKCKIFIISTEAANILGTLTLYRTILTFYDPETESF